MTAVLSINDARKRYGSTQALEGAKLQLDQGEWLALLGPNGAGKTTLIRAIAGRVRLDGGEISLLGTPLSSNGQASAARADLGLVPQDIALYPLLTAGENLRAFGELHGVRGRDIRERVRWALEWTGLADRADSLVKTFSGGMKRRLNIACGVLHRPRVVLLDEPTVGVDPQSRERIWHMLGELRSQGASLLLTTHQLDEAQQMCDRIVIIDHGRTIAEGSLDELVSSTVGRGKRIHLILDRPLRPGDRPAPVVGDGVTALAEGFELDGSQVSCTVQDVAAELPAILARLAASGAKVLDVQVQAPSLHAVFLHLTGHELRE